MKLAAHTTLRVMNLGTREQADFYVMALWQRAGCDIIYGERKRHEIHVARGVFDVPAQEACFVVIPDEITENIVMLTGALDGLPLALVEAQDILHVVNWSRDIRGPDSLVEFAVKVVDLYHEWRRTSLLPVWLARRKRELKARKERNGGGRFEI